MAKLLKDRSLLVLAIVIALLATNAHSQVCASCPSFVKDPPPAAKNLASLVGCWVGKGPRGLGAKVSYELGSDKTAILETMWIEKNPTMYTIYYLDGKVAKAHHFCSYGNQLEMESADASSNPNLLSFKMTASSNLPNPDMNHVFSIQFNFLGEDRFDVNWGLHHDGRDLPQLYHFTRVWSGCPSRSDEW